LTVSFADTSTSYDGIIAWEWDFDNDDVVDSTEQDPIYTYAHAGLFSVSLTVSEDDGDNDTETKFPYIIVEHSVPTASFTYSPPSPIEGGLITFDASSSRGYDPPLSYSWNFSDGTLLVNLTDPIATHIYTQDGNYIVTLTVVDSDATPMSGPEPLMVSFADTSTSYHEIIAWEWDFGDGTKSTSQNVTHRYYALGTFIVNLTVTDDDDGTDTISKSITIYDVVPPVTVDDYDESGRTSDFTINLTATDDLSGVQAIYYIINDGPVMDIQTHGQPRISVEGYNQLEYWV
jgi:PKD repeat protein